MIIEVENKPSLTIKIWLLQTRHTEILRLTQDFGKKLEISSLFLFCKISLEIMSDDHLIKNQPLSQSKVLATFSLATNYSACINFCPKSVSQSAMHSVSQQLSQSASLSQTSQLVSQSVYQPVSRPAS